MHIPNRYSTIHAAILYIFCTNTNSTTLAITNNDTNIICFPGRFMDIEDAKNYIKIWLNTEFLGGKYKDRNDKLDEIY